MSTVTGLVGSGEGKIRCVCGVEFSPRQRNQGYCSSRCYDRAYNERRPVVRQKALDFTPPVRRADDAQAARLQRKALVLLGALQAGPLTNVEAMHLGGLRFGARLHELRKAGHRIETEEHKRTGVTVYRLAVS